MNLMTRNHDGRTKLLLPYTHGLQDISAGRHGAVSLDGTAVYGTAQSKWGPGSLACPEGSSNFASLADHADWDIPAAGPWMAEGWFRQETVAADQVLFRQYVAAANCWYLEATSEAVLFFYTVGGSTIATMTGGVILAATWYHTLAVRTAAGIWGLYVNGTQYGYDTEELTGSSFAAALVVGRGPSSGAGWFNDLRIAHANYYNANPNVGVTDTIKIPTGRLRR